MKRRFLSFSHLALKKHLNVKVNLSVHVECLFAFVFLMKLYWSLIMDEIGCAIRFKCRESSEVLWIILRRDSMHEFSGLCFLLEGMGSYLHCIPSSSSSPTQHFGTFPCKWQFTILLLDVQISMLAWLPPTAFPLHFSMWSPKIDHVRSQQIRYSSALLNTGIDLNGLFWWLSSSIAVRCTSQFLESLALHQLTGAGNDFLCWIWYRMNLMK